MADIDFSFMDDLFPDDADYSYLFDDVTDLTPSMPDTGMGAFDFSNLFNDDEDYSYLFDDVTDLDFDYKPGVDFSDVYDNLFNDNTDYSNLFDYATDLSPTFDALPFQTESSEDEYQGIFGLGIGPKLNQFFTGGQGLAGLLSGSGKKGGGSGGLLGGEGLLGGSGLETLIKLAMINKLRKQDREDPNEIVPIGSDAFSAVGQGLGSMPDYRIFNLQPALMPGVGYANAPPPGMKDGGLTGLSQKIGEGIDNYAISPYLAEVGFFEDPSFAKYVEGARLYNQTTKAPGMFKSVAPFIDDSFEALRDGYEAFLKSFKEKRGLGSLEEDDRVRTKTLPDGTVQFLTGMKDGGLKDGPGDITLARLEPGEFVMTRKATDNIGAKNLYRLMKEAERMA